MKYFTDYPFVSLGDEPYKKAPIREVEIIEYDRNKYIKILVEGIEEEVKAGYIYEKAGRYGEVPQAKFPRKIISKY